VEQALSLRNKLDEENFEKVNSLAASGGNRSLHLTSKAQTGFNAEFGKPVKPPQHQAWLDNIRW